MHLPSAYTHATDEEKLQRQQFLCSSFCCLECLDDLRSDIDILLTTPRTVKNTLETFLIADSNSTLGASSKLGYMSDIITIT